MKLKMLVSMSGADFVLSPGEETERFSNEEAARMIEAGYAVPVKEEARENMSKKRIAETRD